MNTGIDPGLKTTALITLNSNNEIIQKYEFGTEINLKFKRAVKLHPAERYQLYYKEIEHYIKRYKIVGTVIMEQPLGKLYGNGKKISHLYAIYLVCLSFYFESHKIFIPTPTELKKSFTGDGSASKEAMIAQCKMVGFYPSSHHSADAYACATYK